MFIKLIYTILDTNWIYQTLFLNFSPFTRLPTETFYMFAFCILTFITLKMNWTFPDTAFQTLKSASRFLGDKMKKKVVENNL